MPETPSVPADVPRDPRDGGAGCASPGRGGGGRGVRRWAGGRLGANELLQRARDRPVVLGGRDRRRPQARPCSVSPSSCTGCGYLWTGNVSPPRLPDVRARRARRPTTTRCAKTVAAQFGVRGAFGVDAIWDGRELWVLEVNPRPTASLELFAPGAFVAHVRGARGVSLPTSGMPDAAQVCKGEARAVRGPRPPGAGPRLVAARARSVTSRIAMSRSHVERRCARSSRRPPNPTELDALGARLLRDLPDRATARA